MKSKKKLCSNELYWNLIHMVSKIIVNLSNKSMVDDKDQKIICSGRLNLSCLALKINR